ncbi:hypothetical protein [Olivibacter sp. XZL3]|uniref:hypothetical protein n=1 Tax=Olivibacter sp. XZL3 TaxID=1735116 RepID=UPI001066539C|nr:hypothetical protein [Olivibacter sp. XZL3]
MERGYYTLKGKAAERYFNQNDALREFHNLFTYESKDDRTIAILGGTFLEMILEHILYAFFPEGERSGRNDAIQPTFTPKDYFQVGVNSLIIHLNGCVSIARNEKRSIRNNF